MNLSAHPNTLQAIFHFSLQLSQRRGYKLEKVQQSHTSNFAGAQLGFVEVRGLTAKMNVRSIFIMGRSLQGGLGDALPGNFEN